MDINTEGFINANLCDKLFPFIVEHESDATGVSSFFSTGIQQETKDNKITLKQKDTFFIIKESGSIVLGDIALPKKAIMQGAQSLKLSDQNITILPPSIKKDGWHLLSSFLIDDYDLKEPVALINQSKADKCDMFTISCGSIVSISGQLNVRVNVNVCRDAAIVAKEAGVKSAEFSYLCRLKNKFDFEVSDKKRALIESNMKKLFKKYPVLESLSLANKLPLGESPEMLLISWYLREGK
jgi:hypothetical protein